MDMKTFQVLLALLLAAAAADGQSVHLGKCPCPSVQKDFNITQYMGTWYEIQKLPAVFEKGKCVQATYTLLSDGTVKVCNAELLSNGKINSIEGVAKVKDPSQPAILEVGFFKGVPDAPYWIISTDYQSYALVYSCSDYLGLFHIDFAWILSRARVLTDDIISQQRDKLTAAGVKTEGTWYLIQTIPNVMNEGKCDRLTCIILDDNTAKMNFVNIRPDGKQFSMDFVTKVYNHDPSGRIHVKYPGVVRAVHYHVLSVDYNSYVVFFYCSEESKGSISNAWIYSRSPVLSDDIISKLLAKLTAVGLKQKLTVIDQTGCDGIKPQFFCEGICWRHGYEDVPGPARASPGCCSC
ncbi:uncharacterized protein LOC143006749 isoform X1 [Genypterus blacodes]|uniref:uncharacterized protein LOC143006749 isoform X1 n=1 Tax=Genypterus blacodes TaxID=154954 RepID=UPI003F75FB0F